MNQLYNIVKHMNSPEFNINIITLSGSDSNKKAEQFEAEDCEISTLNLDQIPNPLIAFKSVRNKIDQINPDIVHSHGFRSDLLAAYLLTDVDTVSTLHSYHYKNHSIEYGRFLGRFIAWAHLRGVKRIDHPIACSQYVSNQVRKHSIKTDIIRNGVDKEDYKPIGNANKTKIREELNISENDKIILSVGSVNKRKDPLTIIKAFSQASIENAQLLVLGDGPLIKQCRQKASNIPSIRILGRVPSVKEYMQVADFFVSASWYEGFPMAVLEALSSGLPICVSDIEPHREILDYESLSGELFSCGDTIELANVMEAFVQGDISKRSLAARNVIESELNSEKMSIKYQNMYHNIMNGTV